MNSDIVADLLGGSSQSQWASNLNKKVERMGPVQQPKAPAAEDGAAGKPKVLHPPTIEVESERTGLGLDASLLGNMRSEKRLSSPASPTAAVTHDLL
jgi:hypothetical protein